MRSDSENPLVENDLFDRIFFEEGTKTKEMQIIRDHLRVH